MKFVGWSVRDSTLWCLATILVTACTSGTQDAVSNATLTVDAVPAVTISGAGEDGELWFAEPVAATRLSDGAIAIGDVQESAIMFFDSSGRHIGRFGRAGGGPGEFRTVTWLSG